MPASLPHSTIPPSELILNKDGSVYHLNLKPEQIAHKIIAVGDPGRVHRISALFDKIDFEMSCREFITHTGSYKGKRISAISTGMGTDNIEIFMNEIDALVNVDLNNRQIKDKITKLEIVRLGTSGSVQEDIKTGTHLVSEYAIGLDTLMNFYQLPQSDFETNIAKGMRQHLGLNFLPYCANASVSLLERIAFDMVKGNTVTSPGFYAPQGRVLRYKLGIPDLVEKLSFFHIDNFWLTNLEMETSGYYALARLLGHDLLSVNAIISNRITQDFSKNANKVIDTLIKKVLDRI